MKVIRQDPPSAPLLPIKRIEVPSQTGGTAFTLRVAGLGLTILSSDYLGGEQGFSQKTLTDLRDALTLLLSEKA